jgi:hypothetical protein
LPKKYTNFFGPRTAALVVAVFARFRPLPAAFASFGGAGLRARLRAAVFALFSGFVAFAFDCPLRVVFFAIDV